MPLISELRRQKQADIYKSEANQGYITEILFQKQNTNSPSPKQQISKTKTKTKQTKPQKTLPTNPSRYTGHCAHL